MWFLPQHEKIHGQSSPSVPPVNANGAAPANVLPGGAVLETEDGNVLLTEDGNAIKLEQ